LYIPLPGTLINNIFAIRYHRSHAGAAAVGTSGQVVGVHAASVNTFRY
jgi:hypothetical protein